jgi:hypothetical protein
LRIQLLNQRALPATLRAGNGDTLRSARRKNVEDAMNKAVGPHW